MKDAAILANCPDREIRREWIQRLLDHDGAPGVGLPGIGLPGVRLPGVQQVRRGAEGDPHGVAGPQLAFLDDGLGTGVDPRQMGRDLVPAVPHDDHQPLR